MADHHSNLPAAGRRVEHHQGSVKSAQNNLGASPKLRKRVDSLRAIQSQRDELEAKLSEEKAALEAKYQKLYEPLYKRRSEIVTGVVEVDGVTKVAKATREKGVPKFWLNAMQSNAILDEVINPCDELALKYLKDIKWCRIDNPKGFKLEFLFNPNPYFKNTILTKTYHMINEEKAIVDKAIGMNIKWFPGNCLMEKKPTMLPKGINSVIKTESWESFFQFFSPSDNPVGLDLDDVLDLQTKMEYDYEICSIIKHKIIPHAVSWFTGEAAEDVFWMTYYDYDDLGIKHYLFGNNDDDKFTWKHYKEKSLWIKRNRRAYKKYFLESMNECEHHIGYEDYTCKYCDLNRVWDEDDEFGMYDEDDEFGMYDEDYGLEDYNNFNFGLKGNLVSKNIDKVIMMDHKHKAYEKYLLKSMNDWL